MAPSCCSPSSIKKDASWLIIIMTSCVFLVQLGQTSGEMLAGYSFSRHQNPQWLPNPMSQTSVSQSVIVSFSGAVLSWKINFFSLRRKNIEHIFTFGNNLWVFTYGAQVFLQPAVYYRLVMLLCGHDSLFMH